MTVAVAPPLHLSLHTHTHTHTHPRGIVQGGGGVAEKCEEVLEFFRQASSGIHLTAKNIAKPDHVDTQFQFYCLNLLIPTLTALFSHVGLHSAGKSIIGELSG